MNRAGVGAVTTWVLAALTGGLLAGSVHLGSASAVAGGAAAVAILGLAASRGRGLRVLPAGAVLVVVALTGGARVGLRSNGALAELARAGGSARVVATVVAAPRPADDGWWAVVRVESVGERSERQRALLRGTGPPPALRSVWTGRASARPLEPDHPLAARHVAVELSPGVWQLLRPPTPGWRATSFVRERIHDAAVRALPAAEAGLAAGLVTGDTRGLPRDDEAAMLSTGLSHLTAVSGSNVAVIVAGAGMLAALLGLGARGRRRLVLVAVLWFAVLTGADPSVLRAAVMAGLVLLAGARGVLTDVRYSLALAVLLLLLVDPLLARSPGLLLSAAATAGVLLVAPRIARRLTWAPRRVAALLAVSVGAQIAVAPVLLVLHGEVPLAAVPANVLAVPAAAVASVLVGVAAVVAVPGGQVATPVLWAARPFLSAVLATARLLESRVEVVSAARPVLLATVLAAGVWLVSRRGTAVARAAAGVALVGLVAPAPLAALLRPTVTGLVVTAIDVGQGDAVLVEVPGVTVLVDGGPAPGAAGWLRRNGRSDLDLVVLSHPHADHADGLPAAVERSRVGAIWYRPVPNDLDSVDALLAAAARRGVPVHQPSAGATARIGELHIAVLGPPPGRPYRASDSEPNDTSLVLRVSWRGLTALLTGDVEEPAQADLMRSGRPLGADLLKVPHHGAGTTDPEFLRRVAPRDALVSVGEDNRYGHPHPGTLAVLAAAGATIHRTDLGGTVRVPVRSRHPALSPRRATPRAVTAGVTGRRARPAGDAGRGIGSRHGVRDPHRRRRRPALAARARAGPRGPP